MNALESYFKGGRLRKILDVCLRLVMKQLARGDMGLETLKGHSDRAKLNYDGCVN